jgi:hypothetical protein
MKSLFLSILVGVILCTIGMAQPKSDTVVCTLCQPNTRCIATVKNNAYFLQIGDQKRLTIGKGLSKDSARSAYFTALNSQLGKLCQPTSSNAFTYIRFIETSSYDISEKLFPAPYFPRIDHPELVDSLPLGNRNSLQLIRLNDSFILGYFTEATIFPIGIWDTAGRLLRFDTSIFRSHSFPLQFLPAYLSMQAKVNKAIYPQLYLLYDGTIPNYELVISIASGNGTRTGINIGAPIGDTLIQSGKTIFITIEGKHTEVQPIRSVPGPSAAAGPINVSASATSPGSAKSNATTIPDTNPTSVTRPVASGSVATGSPPAAAESGAPLSAAATPINDTSKKGKPATPAPASVTPATTKSDSLSHSMLNNITILNAFNFDFNGPLTASYLGLVNIFAPDFFSKRIKQKNGRFGFLAGLEKINYSTANIHGNDSTQTQYVYQFVLANPTGYDYVNKQISPGSKVYYEYNKYSFSSKNLVLSLYFDPTYRTDIIPFDSSDSKVGLYLHFHGEFMVNEWTNITNFNTLFRDSLNYGSSSASGLASPPANFVHSYLVSPINANYTIISGNFGVGTTLYVAPFPKDSTTHVFFQATVGASINSPNFGNLTTFTTSTGNGLINLPNINGTPNGPITYSHLKAFWLVRSSIMQSLSNKTELILGATIRGVFPSVAPQYAIYFGLNLDFSFFTGLFSSK